MTAHTPGPWMVHEPGESSPEMRHIAQRAGLREISGLSVIGNVEEQGRGVRSYSTVAVLNEQSFEVGANARLIAAAPELLEALRDLVKSCENWAPTIDRSRARAALAKVAS